jgi:signal transduction histidine kinase/predicted RNA-binding protein with RPS1 domain/ActR/RegA family two-component response regulator
VKVEVLHTIASGVLVRLPDGRNGVIRRKELSWSSALDETTDIPSLGETISAVVLEVPSTGLIQLSLRRVQGDPWSRVDEHYPVGSIVTGQVVNFETYGAFIEVEPGIEGLLHISEVPEGNTREIVDLLWVGDFVEVSVKDIDPQERHLKLSIRERLRRRREDRVAAGMTPGAVDTHGALLESAVMDMRLEPPQPQHIRRILIVDDDQPANQALADYLRPLGYQVESAFSCKEALAHDGAALDLIFLDLNLRDGLGSDLIPPFRQAAPDLPIVLVTGKALTTEDLRILDNHALAALLLKPFNYGEISRVLSEAEAGVITSGGLSLDRSDLDSEFVAGTFAPMVVDDSLEEALTGSLERLRELTDAQTVLLFELTMINRQVAIVARAGADLNSEEATLPKLWRSVIKDVALRGQPVLDHAATRSRRFDTLQRLLPFESCVGISISHPSLSDSRYVLFLFDQRDGHFTLREVQAAIAVGYAIAALLHENALTSRMQDFQKLALLGQLSASLVHEIANKLNRVQQQAALLERDCDRQLQAPDSDLGPEFVDHVKRRARRIRDANAYLGDLLLQYRGLMKQERAHEISVNDLLLKAVVEMAPFAEEHKARLEPQIEGYLPHVAIIALRLEQVFLNLMRNAIQLMWQQSRGGVLRIVSRYEPQDMAYPIKVRFEDEGPGIHRQRWDWVFEWGTSTREGGTGLGLFVSKGLMESIGGRLSVERSYMFVGTTFLVELSSSSMKEVPDA